MTTFWQFENSFFFSNCRCAQNDSSGLCPGGHFRSVARIISSLSPGEARALSFGRPQSTRTREKLWATRARRMEMLWLPIWPRRSARWPRLKNQPTYLILFREIRSSVRRRQWRSMDHSKSRKWTIIRLAEQWFLQAASLAPFVAWCKHKVFRLSNKT